MLKVIYAVFKVCNMKHKLAQEVFVQDLPKIHFELEKCQQGWSMYIPMALKVRCRVIPLEGISQGNESYLLFFSALWRI